MELRLKTPLGKSPGLVVVHVREKAEETGSPIPEDQEKGESPPTYITPRIS